MSYFEQWFKDVPESEEIREQKKEEEAVKQKFREQEPVKWNGALGWHIDKMVEKNGKSMMQIGRLKTVNITKKDGSAGVAREIYETHIVDEKELTEEKSVAWKGDPGWHIDKIVEKDGKRIMEIGRMEKDPKGREVYKTQIAYEEELS